jgi:hypothetical protein
MVLPALGYEENGSHILLSILFNFILEFIFFLVKFDFDLVRFTFVWNFN